MRPQPNEYAKYQEDYISLVPGADVVTALATQAKDMTSLFESFPNPSHAYAEGKWTVKQIINHIVDTERVFAYRALRLARADQTPLPGFEQDDWMKFSNGGSLQMAALLDEYQAVRQATVTLVRNFPEEAWSRRGTVNNFDMTVRGIIYCIAGHELHHANILRKNYF